MRRIFLIKDFQVVLFMKEQPTKKGKTEKQKTRKQTTKKKTRKKLRKIARDR